MLSPYSLPVNVSTEGAARIYNMMMQQALPLEKAMMEQSTTTMRSTTLKVK
jgi:hypothetical protein